MNKINLKKNTLLFSPNGWGNVLKQKQRFNEKVILNSFIYAKTYFFAVFGNDY